VADFFGADVCRAGASVYIHRDLFPLIRRRAHGSARAEAREASSEHVSMAIQQRKESIWLFVSDAVPIIVQASVGQLVVAQLG